MDFGRFSLLSRKKSNSRLFENFLRFVVFTLLSAFYGILQHSKTSGTFNSLLFRLDSLISRKIWSLHISKIRSSTFVRQIHRIFVSFSSRKFHWRYSLLFDGKNQSPECSRSFSEVGVFMGFYNTLQSSGTFISLLFVSQKKFQAILVCNLWFHVISKMISLLLVLFWIWRNSLLTAVTQPFDGKFELIKTEQKSGHWTEIRTWDIWTDMGHTDGHLLSKKDFYIMKFFCLWFSFWVKSDSLTRQKVFLGLGDIRTF